MGAPTGDVRYISGVFRLKKTLSKTPLVNRIWEIWVWAQIDMTSFLGIWPILAQFWALSPPPILTQNASILHIFCDIFGLKVTISKGKSDSKFSKFSRLRRASYQRAFDTEIAPKAREKNVFFGHLWRQKSLWRHSNFSMTSSIFWLKCVTPPPC